ncbi:two-component system response regulator YcbB [Paenibacillus amylolyticus]|uniref:Two-component system response regulator YcbB n=1 Tax=Paenibacillus amylolyticus TaxID=1451 RepID=A0AAP5LMI7_PAEAM|nr:response regulator [Paenibacillus amylolyticus]MDR6722795.1 two-component system response regulator YcbB [Paenibacillus amylolyticus]
MTLSILIVDDDIVSRSMLQDIIEECGAGELVGTAEGGIEGEQMIINLRPDVVLIDLLMPDQDGIETVARLKALGFAGKFIMISQVDNKEMVGAAYQQGIEFFIHKPINRVEVEHVLKRVNEQWKYERYVLEIQQSLTKFNIVETPPIAKGRTVRDISRVILIDLGILGESGSKDVIALMEYVIEQKQSVEWPSLKEMYEAVAQTYKPTAKEVEKESKAMEQRIRRTVNAALTNMASIGLTDYSNHKFEHYAPLYFDFQDVRMKMRAMEEDQPGDKGKVNIKKFLHVFYMETVEKLNGG